MALEFDDGNAEGLSAGDVTFLDGIAFTWSASVAPDDLTADHIVWEKNDGSGSSNTITVFLDDSAPGGGTDVWEVFYSQGGSTTARIDGTTKAIADEWNHLSGHVDAGQVDGLSLWLNGTEVNGSPGDMSSTAAMTNTTNPLLIGAHNDGADRRYMSGKISHLTFWDVILDDEEHEALGAGVHPMLIRPGSRLRYWPLTTDAHLGEALGNETLVPVVTNLPSTTDGPPLIYPASPVIGSPSVVAAAGLAFPPYSPSIQHLITR